MKEKVVITSLDHYGRGIGKYYDKTIFVENALPEEEVLIEITDNKKNYCEAVVTEYLKKSKLREKPICPYFEQCGGCHLMHINYQEQLKYKENKVIEIMRKFAKIDKNLIKGIVSTEELYYRNKVTLQVSKKLGFYKSESYEIVEIDHCLITDRRINKIIAKLKTINLENINQIIIRSSFNTDDIMIIFCIYKRIDEKMIIAEFKDLVTSIVKKYKNEEKCIFGKNTIIEKIDDLNFSISPSSFFQVNTLGMTKMYRLIKQYLNPSKDMRILDLYCGAGTIGLYISRYVDRVYGVEISKSAVKDAIRNADLNDITNAEFKCADVKDGLEKYQNIDAVIVDPPRAGLSKEAITDLIKLDAKKIIYVSCDPVTLARDLNIFKNKYDLKEITLIDMFPNTYHVECICLLDLK